MAGAGNCAGFFSRHPGFQASSPTHPLTYCSYSHFTSCAAPAQFLLAEIFQNTYLFKTFSICGFGIFGGLMKLPSIRQLVDHSSNTFSRFPFALTSAVIGTGAWIILFDQSASESSVFLENLAAVGLLGISVFTAITLLCEKLRIPQRQTLLANVAGTGALIIYFLTLPQEIFNSPYSHVIRYILLGAGFHFLIAVGPFFRKGQINGFWQFNKSLFLRFLTAFLYSSVLYCGLAAALLAVDQLFDVNIDGDTYGQLWVFIAGIFNTWFFLSGVPDNLDGLEAETAYPKGLKVFTQYILIPLVFLYLVILYAYEIKIIAEWNWPKGWVGYLVLIFSILGILSLLLVHPIKDRIENAWIRFTSKYLYVALIPLVVLLLLAIWRRISEYGLTERRYFVVVLALWLGAMIVYFLISKTKSIKIIPATLCTIAFLIAFGPWGAMGLSEFNQIGHLSEVLTRTAILQNGKIRKATGEIAFEDQRRVSSIVRYLDETHGLSTLQDWFEVNLDTVGTPADVYRSTLRYGRPQAVVSLMGLQYVDEWQTAVSTSVAYQSTPDSLIDIRGFSYAIRDIPLSSWDTTRTIAAPGVQGKLEFRPSAMTVGLTISNGKSAEFSFDLKPILSELEHEHGTLAYVQNIPASRMSLELSNGAFRAKMAFRSITATKQGDSYRGNHIQGDLYIGLENRR